METDSTQTEITNMYKTIHVEGSEFTGTYNGVFEVKKTGTNRQIVEVITPSLKADLEQLTDTVQTLEKKHEMRVVRGYSDKTDSYRGYDWNPRFFARKIDWNLEEQPAVETQMQFKIKEVEVFGPGNLRDYDYGVNINIKSIN